MLLEESGVMLLHEWKTDSFYTGLRGKNPNFLVKTHVRAGWSF